MNEENAGSVSELKLRETIEWCRDRKASKPWYGEGGDSPKLLTTCDFMVSICTELLALRAADHPAVGVREDAQFLIERLDDFERGSLCDDIEDACRDFDGHVSPAIERLRDALSCIEPLRPATEQAGGEVEDMETVTRQMHAEAKAILHGQPKRFPSPAATQSAVVSEESTHRHVKRGSEYVLIGIGKMQAENWFAKVPGPGVFASDHTVDMREVAIYRSVDDGSLWVRPREEFEDGRFAALSNPGASQ